MSFWRWLCYRELTQTEARERMKQALPAHAPIPPTWRVQVLKGKPKSIEQWKQQHGRRTA